MPDEAADRPADPGAEPSQDAAAPTAPIPPTPPSYGDAPRGAEPTGAAAGAEPTGAAAGGAAGGAAAGGEAPSGAGPTGPPPPPPPPPPWFGAGPADGTAFFSRQGLVRPNQGRYLAGVCAAIGRATNTDPVLWRVVLAVLGLFGVGILLYLIGWLLIPAEGDTASPVEALLGRGQSQTSGAAVLVLGGLAAVSFAFVVHDGFPRTLLGGAVIVGGLLLLKRTNVLGTANGAPPPAPAGTPDAAAATFPQGAAPDPAAAYAGVTPPAAPYATDPDAAAGAPTAPAAPAAEPVTAPLPPLPPPGGRFAAPPPPPPPSGYRPPFAPHGPYAGPQAPWQTAPPPPAPAKPAKPPRVRSKLGRITFFLVLVAIGLIALLDLGGVGVQTSTYFAAALFTVALGLLVGAWIGRARGLIFLALIASIGLAASSATEHWGVDGFTDPVTWQPRTVAGIADHYETPMGDATLDLRNVDFAGQTQETSIVMHAGRLRVLLPPTVDATAQVDVGFGSAKVLGHDADGPDLKTQQVTDEGTDGPGGGALRLAITMDAGDVEVTR